MLMQGLNDGNSVIYKVNSIMFTSSGWADENMKIKQNVYFGHNLIITSTASVTSGSNQSIDGFKASQTTLFPLDSSAYSMKA